MVVYEYVPFPIMFEQKTGPLMFIESRSKALAISESTNNGLEIDLVRLIDCEQRHTHMGNVFLCADSNLVRKQRHVWVSYMGEDTIFQH